MNPDIFNKPKLVINMTTFEIMCGENNGFRKFTSHARHVRSTLSECANTCAGACHFNTQLHMRTKAQ